MARVALAPATTPATGHSCVDRNVAQNAAADRGRVRTGAGAEGVPGNAKIGTLDGANLVAAVPEIATDRSKIIAAMVFDTWSPVRRASGLAA